VDILARNDFRLVTLTGPAGVGKTRLALKVAAEVSNDFSDGIHFVSLESIVDFRFVVPTIAQRLGLWQSGEAAPLERLKRHLFGQQLLVLDNFEQVLPAAPPLTELLATCPGLRIMVTSRSLLRLSGEHEYVVPPLPTPNLNAPISQLQSVPSVELFLARARALKPGLELDDGTAPAIAQICMRLDGLPLALELAAARIKVLAPQAMLAWLDQSLLLLTGGALDAPERHQSLRNAIQWSYGLLDESEKRLFRCLSVFIGGCSLDAVAAIGEGGPVALLNRIASLVDKSLIRAAEARFSMLETMRDFAWEQLLASGEAEQIKRAHFEYFLELAEAAEAQFNGPDQPMWLERLAIDTDNLRAALRFAVDCKDATAALRLCAALWRFWFWQGQLGEGRRWLDQALSIEHDAAPAARARGRVYAGFLASNQGDFARAEALCEEGLQVAQRLSDRPGQALALMGLGHAASWGRNAARAHDMFEASLGLFRALGDAWGVATTLTYLGNIAYFHADYSGARPLLEEALALFRKLGQPWGIGVAQYCLGLATLSERAGSFDARAHLQAAYEQLNRLGDLRSLIRVAVGLGRIALDTHELRQARTHWQEGLSLAQDVGDQWAVAHCLDGFAGLFALEHRPQLAARLFGAADGLRRHIGAGLPPAFKAWRERELPLARSALGSQAFETAFTEGCRLDLDQALALLATPEPDAPQIARSATMPLTGREVEVLRLLTTGLTNAQIAEKLVVSPTTVNAHLRNIYTKLDLPSRTAAVRFAVENGLT
jgi:predicted ATPase/DNA-binding CsgD family transcriptional regulator